MLKVLFRARDAFHQNQDGNVAMLFAFAAIPLVGLLGGALDVTRHSRHKMQMLNNMDSATVALVRRGADSDADADQFVNDFIAALAPATPDPMLHLANFNATEIEGGYRVESDGYMDAAFMPVIGIRRLDLDLTTEVLSSSGKFEVALALDNTGSMARLGRIEALRESAANLVDNLYEEEGAKDRVKMALVPFVTSVNIKSTNPDAFDQSWIDPIGDTELFGDNFSAPADRLALFAAMRVPWKGCVEARADAIDADDTAFNAADPATKWVPYLWPDEPDKGSYKNSYLTDAADDDDWTRLRDVTKYKVGRRTRVSDTTSKGPNAACPRGVVELTDDTERMKHEIELMNPHNTRGGNSSGTNVEQGLLWAWRVLSPEAPFDQGASYSDQETTKVLVLLSDGRNQIVQFEDEERVTMSDYNSYGYLAAGRLGTETDYLQAERAVDEKVKRVCGKIKDKGIRVYTILFQVDFESTQDIFRDCASKDEDGQPLYYYVPDADALETAFSSIGKDLTSIHIAR